MKELKTKLIEHRIKIVEAEKANESPNNTDDRIRIERQVESDIDENVKKYNDAKKAFENVVEVISPQKWPFGKRNKIEDDVIKNILVTRYIDVIKAKLRTEKLRYEVDIADWSFNFFQINCGILGGQNNELSESIRRLFGTSGNLYEAIPGVFQICSYVGGTLFLDEIADAPVRIQDNLLRPLEEGKVGRLGWETIDEDVKNIRIIGATFKDLFKLAKQYQETLLSGNPNGFRPDLLTRLTQNPPVSVTPIWHYFVPKSSSERSEYPGHFSYVLKDAFDVDSKVFWEQVYIKVSGKLEECDRMAEYRLPDPINRRRHFASKLTMRLFKHIGKLAEQENKRPDILKDYLPRMLDYLLSDS